MNAKKQPSPARDYLRQISQQLKPAAAMRGLTINDLLTEIYSQQANCGDWGTFAQWKKQGYRVQKGESGFAVWSRPMKNNDTDSDDGTPTDADAQPGTDTDATDGDGKKEREFFRVAYIFNARQVATREGITAEGADYAPTGYTPPHANHQPAPADTDAQPGDTQPAEADAQPAPQPQPQPAQPTPPATQPQPAPTYIEQLALAF